MKTFLRLIVMLTLLGGLSALRAERFDAASWAKVQSYDVSALEKLDRIPVGQVIGIKFNYRHKRIRHLKPNWYQGSLWGHTPEGKKRFTFVQVMVPKAALPAFEAISTDFNSGGEFVAYGQVMRDTEADKFRFVRLFGTKVARDSAGNATVSW